LLIRIANIIEEGRLGGPQLRITATAERLRDFNVHTTVIFPEIDSKDFHARLSDANIPNKQFPLHRLTKEKIHLFKYFLFWLYEVFLLFKYLKNESFDIVHISGGSWQVKGVIAAKLAGCKILWHLNDTFVPKYLLNVFKFLSRYADGFIVSALKVKDFYNKTFTLKRPVFLIRPPVDCSYYNPEIVKTESECTDKSIVTIGTVANINPVKGIEYFIEMASILNHKYCNLQFIIIGPVFKNQEKYYKKLKQKIEVARIENVKFLGSLIDVRPVLKSMNIYICSSLFESGPMSLWEAMSMEKAVVSTDVGDVKEFIESGHNGFIVPPGDSNTLADKVEILINDENLRDRFGIQSRQVALSQLDLSICVAEHLNAYRSLIIPPPHHI
jgi:glycosyltransferase involved in cell wall biosynthesis